MTLEVHQLTNAIDGAIRLNVDDAGEGPAVLLIHGFTGNHRFFRRVASDLRRNGYRAVVPDLRGHGASQKPQLRSAYGIPTQAADVVALLDHMEVSRCTIVGHSMGGYIAQELALNYSMRLNGLVIVDAGYGRRYASEQEAREKLEMFEQVAAERGMDGLFDSTWGHLPFPSSTQRTSALRMFKETTIDAFMGCQYAMADWGSQLNQLPQVSVPTLLVAGGDGSNVELMCEMERAIPNSTLVVVSEAGHNVFLDKPREFTSALLGFLQAIT